MSMLFASALLEALIGCATGVVEQAPTPDQPTIGKVFTFQQKSLAPPGGAQLIAPADVMHMREGDVSSLPVEQRLVYVGHLKRSAWALDVPVLQMPLSGFSHRTPPPADGK